MAQPRNQRDTGKGAGNAPGRDGSFGDRDGGRVSNAMTQGGGLGNPVPSGLAPPMLPFVPQQQNPMSMMYQRSMAAAAQLPMMGNNMPMMNMNPMAMAMGMGMNNFNQIGGMNPAVSGMNMMGGTGGMNPMGVAGMGAGMNNMAGPMGNMSGTTNMGMNNLGAMRLGMGPMGVGVGGGGGMAGGMGAGGMGNMGAVGMGGGMVGNMGAGMNSTGMGMMGGGMGTMGGMGMNPMGGLGGMAAAAGMRVNLAGMGNQFGGRMMVNNGPGPSRMSNRGAHSFHPYSR